jgi:hypothetical protein
MSLGMLLTSLHFLRTRNNPNVELFLLLPLPPLLETYPLQVPLPTHYPESVKVMLPLLLMLLLLLTHPCRSS